jgi:hypothetical protein
MKRALLPLACATTLLVACESAPTAPGASPAPVPPPSLDRIRTDQTLPIPFAVVNPCVDELVSGTGEMRISQRGFTDASGTRLRIYGTIRGTGTGAETGAQYSFAQAFFQTLVQTTDPFTAVSDSRSTLYVRDEGPGDDFVVTARLKTVCDAPGECRAEIDEVEGTCLNRHRK